MGRNFKNEYEWEKEKYSRVTLKLEKNIAEELKKKADKNNTNVSAILKKLINEYLHI